MRILATKKSIFLLLKMLSLIGQTVFLLPAPLLPSQIIIIYFGDRDNLAGGVSCCAACEPQPRHSV